MLTIKFSASWVIDAQFVQPSHWRRQGPRVGASRRPRWRGCRRSGRRAARERQAAASPQSALVSSALLLTRSLRGKGSCDVRRDGGRVHIWWLNLWDKPVGSAPGEWRIEMQTRPSGYTIQYRERGVIHVSLKITMKLIYTVWMKYFRDESHFWWSEWIIWRETYSWNKNSALEWGILWTSNPCKYRKYCTAVKNWILTMAQLANNI